MRGKKRVQGGYESDILGISIRHLVVVVYYASTSSLLSPPHRWYDVPFDVKQIIQSAVVISQSHDNYN